MPTYGSKAAGSAAAASRNLATALCAVGLSGGRVRCAAKRRTWPSAVNCLASRLPSRGDSTRAQRERRLRLPPFLRPHRRHLAPVVGDHAIADRPQRRAAASRSPAARGRCRAAPSVRRRRTRRGRRSPCARRSRESCRGTAPRTATRRLPSRRSRRAPRLRPYSPNGEAANLAPPTCGGTVDRGRSNRATVAERSADRADAGTGIGPRRYRCAGHGRGSVSATARRFQRPPTPAGLRHRHRRRRVVVDRRVGCLAPEKRSRSAWISSAFW